MTRRAARLTTALLLATGLAACSGSGSGNQQQASAQPQQQSTFWDLFSNRRNSNDTVAVNKYLWNASLEILNFLPVQTIDPFTGVIVTGYGTPPGGGRSYRATVQITDPALDARGLKVSLQGAGGASVAPDTVRAVEDAILTRARQLRAQDRNL
ncbi:DUF3576 domain-containing protein [Paracoccus shanxieyensis]|uniref:DUF3576 domain-containing protein n=1 Tax=Paracoccus shanxieyensis TaxID=2675752 RepID=A0A6L6IXL7_9RHOB|nr:DUF3576 domain-containing protein [Paracoccus shanxieyensis]MTH65256.1 DUF3576 domain-containing protein [Paracoccus shanxieyensis]MTH88440.1 DUF3576 domain-containing protein [Paracoccus shanxieyensis]